MATPLDPCAPPPKRCKTPIYPLSRPGISARHIPTCTTGSLCDLYGCGSPNWRVTNAGTLDRSHWIEGWIATQLFTRGEVSCQEHPLGKRDGGWWADSFRSDRFKSGSKLWSLQWSWVTNDTLIKAKAYALEALRFLLAWGVASRLTVDAQYVSRFVMRLRVTVTVPGAPGTPVAPTSFMFQGEIVPAKGWLWSEYKP